MKENNEKKIKNCNEISKLIKAFPKDIAALDKRSVLAKVNSEGSGRQKPKEDKDMIVNEISLEIQNIISLTKICLYDAGIL